jgi:Domain of unknown function (DUF3854)/Domain of unknown function (DUF927)
MTVEEGRTGAFLGTEDIRLMAERSHRSNWREVNAAAPCPICNHTHWCSISADGTLAKCMHVEAGSFKTKVNKHGAPYHLHRLDSIAPPGVAPPWRPSGPEVQLASTHVLNRVYAALLAGLPLSNAHRDALRGRGFSNEEIDRRGYRTLFVKGRARLARQLRERFGDDLLTVPGFFFKPGDEGLPFLSIAGAAGLLIPVRDLAGQIIALKVRTDTPRPGAPRYFYLSSVKYGGPGPGSPAHVPLGVQAPAEVGRLTEGELKADLATVLSGLPSISAPGATNWRAALDVLQALSCRIVRLAFDADTLDNAHVARALVDCCEAAATAGLAVEMERWIKEDGKGIDDLLSGGKAPEVLVGEAARRAIAEAITEATAGEPIPEPGPLGRLPDVLADGGAEALFRNGELLQALAGLAEADPAEFACRRAQLQRAGVKLRDLDRALAPLRQEIRRERPPLDAAGCYRISAGRIVRLVQTKDGPVEVPLANWSGRIVEETVHDDGAERRLLLSIEGALADGTPLTRVEVPADRFAFMRWPVEAWGTRAVVLAGPSTADHLRVALQLLSGDVPRRVVHGHTGWHKIDGRWAYLHAGGAIGAAGAVEGVAVSLTGHLAHYNLPRPPTGEELIQAIRASLAVRSAGPTRVTTPLLGAAYRAPLGQVDCSLFVVGTSGAGKSELSALAMQHYGPGMGRLNLPGNWSSTANALEALAFLAKDALLVLDDFKPGGSKGEIDQWHSKADRVLRAQGNASARQRCRSDGTPATERPPRGLIVSSGEDSPRGESLQARNLPLPLARGDVNISALTPYQQAAAQGLYAQAMAGYLRWLAQNYEEWTARLGREHAEFRDRAMSGSLHPRVPGVVANLALGWNYFLAFALQVGAISEAERNHLAQQVWDDLIAAAAVQTAEIGARDCGRRFLELVVGALNSGEAHLTGPDAGEPAGPGAWGWYKQELRDTQGAPFDSWRSQGHPIGWVDGDDVFLDPEGSYAAAQRLAEVQGERLPVTQAQLHRRLKEQGLLASSERDRTMVRRVYQGRSRPVLHLRRSTLVCRKPGIPVVPVGDPENPGEYAPVSPPGFDGLAEKPVGETGANASETGGENAPTPGTTGNPGSREGGGAAGADSFNGSVQEGAL